MEADHKNEGWTWWCCRTINKVAPPPSAAVADGGAKVQIVRKVDAEAGYCQIHSCWLYFTYILTAILALGYISMIKLPDLLEAEGFQTDVLTKLNDANIPVEGGAKKAVGNLITFQSDVLGQLSPIEDGETVNAKNAVGGLIQFQSDVLEQLDDMDDVGDNVTAQNANGVLKNALENAKVTKDILIGLGEMNTEEDLEVTASNAVSFLSQLEPKSYTPLETLLQQVAQLQDAFDKGNSPGVLTLSEYLGIEGNENTLSDYNKKFVTHVDQVFTAVRAEIKDEIVMNDGKTLDLWADLKLTEETQVGKLSKEWDLFFRYTSFWTKAPADVDTESLDHKELLRRGMQKNVTDLVEKLDVYPGTLRIAIKDFQDMMPNKNTHEEIREQFEKICVEVYMVAETRDSDGGLTTEYLEEFKAVGKRRVDGYFDTIYKNAENAFAHWTGKEVKEAFFLADNGIADLKNPVDTDQVKTAQNIFDIARDNESDGFERLKKLCNHLYVWSMKLDGDVDPARDFVEKCLTWAPHGNTAETVEGIQTMDDVEKFSRLFLSEALREDFPGFQQTVPQGDELTEAEFIELCRSVRDSEEIMKPSENLTVKMMSDIANAADTKAAEAAKAAAEAAAEADAAAAAGGNDASEQPNLEGIDESQNTAGDDIQVEVGAKDLGAGVSDEEPVARQ